MSNEIVKLAKNADELNKRYGNGFGTKLVIFLFIFGIVFAIILLGIFHIQKAIESNTIFLNSPDRFIVCEEDLVINPIIGETRSTNHYYEIDFKKENVTCRSDTAEYKRLKSYDVKTDISELKQLITQIISDENNLSRPEYNHSSSEYPYICLYCVKDSNNNKYYIHNINQIERIKKMLYRTEEL